MNKNGFTLIELLGVIIILVVILAVTVPSVISNMKKNTLKEIDIFEENMEKSAQTYVELNWDEFKLEFQNKNINDNYCLPLNTLIQKKYINLTDIDPNTKDVINPLNKYILIKNESESSAYEFNYDYIDITKDVDSVCGGIA
jgi:prepilin-type N-terminal cleavage/methylation domain-containing protein